MQSPPPEWQTVLQGVRRAASLLLRSHGGGLILLFVGLLGGFTTFSAFGLETVQLLRRGDWLLAGAYAGGSVLLGLAAVWLGLRLAGPA